MEAKALRRRRRSVTAVPYAGVVTLSAALHDALRSPYDNFVMSCPPGRKTLFQCFCGAGSDQPTRCRWPRIDVDQLGPVVVVLSGYNKCILDLPNLALQNLLLITRHIVSLQNENEIIKVLKY